VSPVGSASRDLVSAAGLGRAETMPDAASSRLRKDLIRTILKTWFVTLDCGRERKLGTEDSLETKQRSMLSSAGETED
jgi:hypothetical protein